MIYLYWFLFGVSMMLMAVGVWKSAVAFAYSTLRPHRSVLDVILDTFGSVGIALIPWFVPGMLLAWAAGKLK